MRVRLRWPRMEQVNAHDAEPSSPRRVLELIQLGRDREAAELGHRVHSTQGRPMDVRSQLEELGPELARVVGGISADKLDNATPCANFTVRGVLEHMVGGATAFAAAFRGADAPPADTGDVLLSFGPVLTDLVTAIGEPGALDRTVQAPFGAVPGETFARFVVLDGLVHGWDLATATGQAYEPPEALVAEVYDFAVGALESLRDGETFAQPVAPPAGASPIERLAAFTGRRV